MKFIKSIVINGAFSLIALSSIQATMVEYSEDVYSAQAPQEIVALAQKAAVMVGFDKTYEVVAPKQPGIEINPINKFVAYGVNQVTKNHFIMINPEWLAKMPEEQQLFFFVRSFSVFKEGKTFLMQALPYLYMLLSFLLVFLLFWLLGKTPLRNKKTWIRVLVAFLIAGACEPLFLDRLYAGLLLHLGRQYDVHILKSVVEKTKDKDAAIKALEFYDASIEEEVQKDEKFWTPYKGLFGKYAQELKNS